MFARALKAMVNGVAFTTAGAIALAHPTNAQAQRRLEIAPVLGAYMPTRHLPQLGDYEYGCAVPGGAPPCPAPDFKQTRAVAVGGRVTAWLSNRGAIEGSLWYSPSGVTGWLGYEAAANIVVADLRVVLSLAPPAPTTSVLLMAGPAVIHRSGDAYADVRGTTSPGGALGVGLNIHPGRHFGLRAQIDDYLYRVKFASGTGPGVSAWKFQHDFVFSLSISPFGRRGERR